MVDGSGKVTVAGTAWNGSSFDYHTIQYSNSGAVRWEQRFNNKYNFTDTPMDMATTPDGGIVVTGQSLNPGNSLSYITVKYVELDFVMPADSDSISTSMRFLANRDQLLGTDGEQVERVRYYSNQCYPNVYLMDDTLSYVFSHIDDDSTTADTMHRIDMTFAGSATGKQLRAIDKETYFNNYYLGHIPEGRPFVSLYKHLFMQEVWPHVDVEYSSNQRGLKYYFIVHSSGEPSEIVLDYHGHDGLTVDATGALVIESSIGELVQPQALAYEMDASGGLTLLGWQPDYVVSGGQVSLDGIGSYDGDLVIEVNWGYVQKVAGGSDNLQWSTYFGGSRNEKGTDIETDQSLNSYNVGYTHSINFPVLLAFQTQNADPNNSRDIYIAKFDVDAVQRWTTYYGGTGEDVASAVAVSALGVYFTGFTTSPDFPRFTPVGSYNQVHAGGYDAYVAEFDQLQGIPIWVSYFGGESTDEAKDIVLDVANEGVIIAGITRSGTSSQTCMAPQVPGIFPICSSNATNEYLQPNRRGMMDGFIAYFGPHHPGGGSLLWSTYVGGDESTTGFNLGEGIFALAYDQSQNKLFAAGQTKTINGEMTSPCNSNNNGNFPTCNSGSSYYQNGSTGNSSYSDGFIMEFDGIDHSMNWSTYFGGSGNELIGGMALNSNHDLIAVGVMDGSPLSNSCVALTNGDFPLCNSNGLSEIQTTYGGGLADMFITRFGQSRELLWSTPLGGTQWDRGQLWINTGEAEVVIGNHDNIYVIGTFKTQPNSTTGTIPQQAVVGWHNQDIGNPSETSTAGDALLLGFDSNNALFWATAFGGAGTPTGGLSQYDGTEDGMSIAFDGNNYLYITGGTYSPTTPTACPPPSASGALPFCVNGTGNNHYQMDAYIARFDIADAYVSVAPSSENDQDLLIFPNPNTGIFDLEFKISGTHSGEVVIYDLLGNKVFDEKATLGFGHVIEIDLLDLASGIYFAKVKAGNKTVLGRLVKM